MQLDKYCFCCCLIHDGYWVFRCDKKAYLGKFYSYPCDDSNMSKLGPFRFRHSSNENLYCFALFEFKNFSVGFKGAEILRSQQSIQKLI